jgi:transcriptional regulator with XRE-family HTH domain
MSNSAESTMRDELARTIDARPGRRSAFAKDVGISQVYLSQILTGKRPLSRLPISTGRKISEVSGISLDRLAGTAGSDDAATPSLAPGEGQQ